MELGRTAKIVIGLATCWPAVYLCIFFIAFFAVFLPSAGTGGNRGVILAIFAMHFFTIFLLFGLFAFYIFYLVKTDRLTTEMKIFWAILICVMSIVSMPIFYFRYVLPNKPPGPDPCATPEECNGRTI